MPKTRRTFWEVKLKDNVDRDGRVGEELRLMGWKVMIVWECQLADEERVAGRLARALVKDRKA